MRLKLISALVVLACPLAALAAQYQTLERPRQECWNEQVQVQPRNGGGALLGGIAGGILGNQIGGGNGRLLATAVGAVSGAAVGQNLSAPRAPSMQTVQRCRTVVERVAVPVYRARPMVLVEPAPVYAPGYYAATNYATGYAGPRYEVRDGHGRYRDRRWHGHERDHGEGGHGGHHDRD